jgi:DNA-binding transcriptional LysR family regulator
MQIDQIRAFVRCAELGSLSAAARAEGVPKSTLSRILHDLEQSLKVELLKRTSRGVVLTQDGRVFLGHARQILEDVDAAAAAVRHTAAAPAGTIRFTAPYTFGVTFIAPLMPGFFRSFPSINVHVELTSRNVDFLTEGYDVGIRIGPPPPELVARRIMGNTVILCASADYLARRGNPSVPADLAAHHILLIGSPRSTSALRLWNAGAASLVTTTPRMVSTDPAMILRSVLEGAGIGQIPVILARSELAKGELVHILPAWTMPEVDISVIYPAGRPLAPRVRVFVDFICDALARAVPA